MTLLAAPFDVSTRPAATVRKYSPDAIRRTPRKVLYRKRERCSIIRERLVWLWTLLAAVVAIILPALLRDTLSLFSGAIFDVAEQPANETTLEISSNPSFAIEAPRTFAPETNLLPSISLPYHGNILGAKSLLGEENVALLDTLQQWSPTLEHAIGLSLTELSLTKLAESVRQTKGKNARVISRLARVTVYWPEEGDFYTKNRKSSTGVRLRDGHCAVDPKVIPYGSLVKVPGVGSLVAVDTGGAVTSRRAARLTGRTREQRSAIVIDIFCSSRSKALALIKRVKHFAVISWQRPERTAQLRSK